MEHEMEQEEQLSKIDDTNGETNPYQELVVNKAEKIESLMTQMEQWSILSNVLNYVQHGRFHSVKHTLDIKAVNKYKHRSHTENKEFKELDFSTTPQKLQEEYIDIYEGIQSERVNSNRFDENSQYKHNIFGKSRQRKQKQIKSRRVIPNIRTWVYIR